TEEMRLRLFRNLRRLLLAALTAVLAAAPAAAQTLTIGVPGGPASLDPHANAAPDADEALRHVFDTLVGSDPRLQPEPGLAASWKAVEPTVWEFRLRPGVKFHDGRELAAEDVVFSLERARAGAPDPASSPVRHVKEAAVADPQTVRIVTEGPAPTLPHDLTGLFVVSRSAVEPLTNETAAQS